MSVPEAEARTLQLEPTPCPVCGHDEGEPVAVGTDFAYATSPESFLALRCNACALVYLNPVPAPPARHRIYPAPYFRAAAERRDERRGAQAAARRALACAGSLPPTARLLELGYGARLHVDELRRLAPAGWTIEAITTHATLLHAAQAGSLVVHRGTAVGLASQGAVYDAILALHALEHAEAPVEELRSLRPLLRPGGRVIVLCQNAESAVGRRFQGRHWAGYDFPRHRVLFGPRALRALAERAGFTVERLAGVPYARMWSRSAANLLRDWAAPRWLSGEADRGGLLAAPLAAVAEATAGRGPQAAWIEAVLAPSQARR